MSFPDLSDFPLLGRDAFSKDSNLPDLQRFDQGELEEFREFMRGRHSQEEWDAFFQYLDLPPWKRVLSRVTGVMCAVLGL